MKRRTLLSLVPRLLAVAAMLAAVPAVNAQSATQQQTVPISGKILGASGNHTVYVALWDAPGFLAKPVQQVQIKAHAATDFQFRVPPGSWAISAYEDQNENGKLDMGMLGPREPSGFWRPFHGWHKPRFAEVSSAVSKDIPNADIQLH